MEDSEFSTYRKYRRCILCKNFVILQQCFNIFHTRLEEQNVLLSDFLKSVLDCSVLIVIAPEFFVCKRCFTVCTELDLSLARCNKLKGVINSLFRNETCDDIENFTNIVENFKPEIQLKEIFCSDEVSKFNGEPEKELNGEPEKELNGALEEDFTSFPSFYETSVDITTSSVPDKGSTDIPSAEAEVPLDNQEISVDLKEIDQSESTKTPLRIKFKNQSKDFVVTLKKRKKVYLCNYCKFETSSHVLMEKHMITHRTVPHILCDICGKRFKFMKTFKRHQNIHDESRPFLCKLCPFRSNTLSDLKDHEESSHSNMEEFACEDCSYKTFKRRALKDHRRRHTEERPYCCPDCPYKAKDSSTLHRHRRLHSGLKKYHCTYCSFRATQKETLNKHIRRHTGEKPFACPHCEYRSSIKVNLSDHIAVRHSSSKPHACGVCSYTCKTRSALSRHMKSHNNKKSYVCDVCGFKSNYRSGLKYHMCTKHPVDGQSIPKSYSRKKKKISNRTRLRKKPGIIYVIGEKDDISNSVGVVSAHCINENE